METVCKQELSQYFRLVDGRCYDRSADEFPCRIQATSREPMVLAAGTHYGYVAQGSYQITHASGVFTLRAGMYFSLAGQVQCVALDGEELSELLVITRIDYNGLNQWGGPIEDRGRLGYIDGCMDTLLIAPPVLGDPCLNILYIPPHEQTQHTHPSLRAGVIVSGSGYCRTPYGDQLLTPGLGFILPAQAQHSFHTTNEGLRVIAWHPDSDTGPRHDDHPMLNRTMVDGVSARNLAIRTTMG